jgi:6-phosphogluconolactonase/glucosamine-6-phosphate isomerase/deaminase
MLYKSQPLNTLFHTQIYLLKERWAIDSSKIILTAISSILSTSLECKIAVTGGRSAGILYSELANILSNKILEGLRLYQTDERFVPFEHPDNNSRMICNSLLKNRGDITLTNFFGIDTSCDNIVKSALSYNDIFPDQLDILILTIGDDGHIASIFPGNNITHLNDKITFVNSDQTNKNFHSRITITPNVIINAKQIFVLAPTDEKKSIMNIILETKDEINCI